MVSKPVHVEVRYSLMFEGVYQTGDGSGSGGIIDRAMRMRRIDGHETLFVPGSALKGALRHATLQFCHSLDSVAKRDPTANEACVKIVPYLFGEATKAEALRFSDAIHSGSESDQRERLELRTGVQIDRKTGAAVEDHLFIFECAHPSGLFTGTIEGYLADGPHREAVTCLLVALSKLRALGSRRSVGWGNIRQVDITSVKVEDGYDWKKEALSLWKQA